MNTRNLIFALILGALILETTILPFPLVFALSLLAYILYPQGVVVIACFFAGLLLDALKVSPIGITPVVILGSFAAIEFIKKMVNFKSIGPIILVLFFASYAFARAFSYNDNLVIYILVFAVATGIFSYVFKKPLW